MAPESVRDPLGPTDVVSSQDGEVEEFFLLPVPQAAALVLADDSEYKPNCNLVVLDFLIRHGFITPEHPGYLDVFTGLRSGDCS